MPVDGSLISSLLDTRQIYLLESLEHPDMGATEDGRPVLRIRRAKHRAAVEAVDLEAVHAELETVSAWTTLVRAVGKARLMPRMARYPNTASLTRALAVAAVLYRFWDPLLVEPGDLERFCRTYLDPATGRFLLPLVVHQTLRMQSAFEARHLRGCSCSQGCPETCRAW